MQLAKGSATVPVALFGVSSNSWCNRFRSPFGALARVLPARRRDAGGSGRDDRAPHESTAWFRLSQRTPFEPDANYVVQTVPQGPAVRCVQFFQRNSLLVVPSRIDMPPRQRRLTRVV